MLLENSENLIRRQIKAGRTDLAERTWPQVKDRCIQPGDPGDYSLQEKMLGDNLRSSLWWAAASSSDPSKALNWLVSKAERLRLSPLEALGRMKAILSGQNDKCNLAAADWLMSAGGVPSALAPDTLNDLFHAARIRRDGSGLKWLFRQPWDLTSLTQNADNPLLLRVIRVETNDTLESMTRNLVFLMDQGVKPQDSVYAELGFAPGTSVLSALAMSYWQMQGNPAFGNEHPDPENEQRMARLWQALILAGDDPERPDVWGITPRQRIVDTPLAIADQALLRAQRTNAYQKPIHGHARRVHRS